MIGFNLDCALSYAFRYPFWALLAAALLRSVYVVTVYTVAGDREKALAAGPYMLFIQGAVCFVVGHFLIANSESPLAPRSRTRCLKYLGAGVIMAATAVIPVLGYSWLNFSFSIAQVISFGVVGLGQGIRDHINGHTRFGRSQRYVLLCIVGTSLCLANSSLSEAFSWKFALYVLGLGLILLFRDHLGRSLKASHGDRYLEAVGENLHFSSIPIMVAGIALSYQTRFLERFDGMSSDKIILAIAGSFSLALSIAIESWIAKPKGGFRENSVANLSRMLFSALIGISVGASKDSGWWLTLATAIAILGLWIQFRKFEERRKLKALREFRSSRTNGVTADSAT